MNADTEAEVTRAVFQRAWEQVLPIPEIIKQGTARGFKLSGEGRPLGFTLLAVEIARENVNYQVVVEQNSDLIGLQNTMVCGTAGRIATNEPLTKIPEPPILIFLFDYSGVRFLRFELDKTPDRKNRLWLFEDSVWKIVWVQP